MQTQDFPLDVSHRMCFSGQPWPPSQSLLAGLGRGTAVVTPGPWLLLLLLLAVAGGSPPPLPLLCAVCCLLSLPTNSMPTWSHIVCWWKLNIATGIFYLHLYKALAMSKLDYSGVPKFPLSLQQHGSTVACCNEGGRGLYPC